MDDERPGGRARRVDLVAGVVVGVVTVLVSLAGWLTTRPADDAGRSAVEIAEEPADRQDGAVSVAADAAAPAAAPAAQSSVQAAPPTPRSTAAPPSTAGPADSRPAAAQTSGAVPAQTSGAVPVQVAVPALGVDAEIDAVGVEPDGSMTIPASPDRVGWYRWGPPPGASAGSAVLAGHVETARDGPGAFAPLSALEVGQDVVVTLGDGTELVYRVEGRESVTKSELPVQAIFARDGAPRLTLVTCGGPFQPELRSYRDNVIVTAVPVGAP